MKSKPCFRVEDVVHLVDLITLFATVPHAERVSSGGCKKVVSFTSIVPDLAN
jgi:hypothetical protein